jgi:hypothetical protein
MLLVAEEDLIAKVLKGAEMKTFTRVFFPLAITSKVCGIKILQKPKF